MKGPKGIAIMLLKKKREEEGGADESPSMPAGEEVAQELIDAVKAGDAAAVWKAYRGLAACASEDEDEE